MKTPVSSPTLRFSTNGAAGDLKSVEVIEEQLRNAQSLPDSDSRHLALPAGYSLEAVGSFKNQIEANRRLMWIYSARHLYQFVPNLSAVSQLADLDGCI